jgi:hypothetical protein
MTEVEMVLLKAYVVGGRFMAPVFRSGIMSEIVEHVLTPNGTNRTTIEYVELVKYAHQNIPAKSVVLQLLADGFT